MQLADLLARQLPPAPWAEGDNIPWHEPAFSARMLAEHLSQDYDAASRRAATIERQIAWVHRAVLHGQPTKVLDLGCGPGLYTSRLARLGHTCVGIDYGPAAIAYAQAAAAAERLSCRYQHADIRDATYGTGFGLALLIYGELNVFPLEQAARILVLREHFWDPSARVATIRYYVVALADGVVTRYAQSMQAYTEQEYRGLLHAHGFTDVTVHPALSETPEPTRTDFCAIVARKRPLAG